MVLQGRARRVVQAVLYETFAVAFVGPSLAWAFGHDSLQTTGLALLLSAIALAWNYVFNFWFERWESRQSDRTRTVRRRLLHGVGFEGGLCVLLVPVMAWGLSVTLWAALVADLALLLFFFVYAIGFTWAFDRVFGLPESARPRQA